MSKGFCYKTLENYDIPRDQLKSLCKYNSKAGYYNISSNRGICNSGQCRTRENFQPTPWQQPAAVRGTWNQVKGLYELNPQRNSCVSWRGGNRENYQKSYENPENVECNISLGENAVNIKGIDNKIFCSPNCENSTCPPISTAPHAGVFASCNLSQKGGNADKCSIRCRKDIDTCPGSSSCVTNGKDNVGYCLYDVKN